MSIPGYTVLRWTNHFSIIDGAHYQDAVALRLADGQQRLIGVLVWAPEMGAVA